MNTISFKLCIIIHSLKLMVVVAHTNLFAGLQQTLNLVKERECSSDPVVIALFMIMLLFLGTFNIYIPVIAYAHSTCPLN